jgi:hypothetical protein
MYSLKGEHLMEKKLKQIGIIVLVAALTLGALIGIQYGWKKFMHEDPTVAKLKAIQGVNSVDMTTQKPELSIEVLLNNVENLKQTSQQLLEASNFSKIIIKDNRTPELQALLEKTRFDIEEAMVRGDFTAMQKAIEVAAKDAKLDRHAVYLDAQYIYLEFHKGDSNLYQVFPRQQGKEQIVTKG